MLTLTAGVPSYGCYPAATIKRVKSVPKDAIITDLEQLNARREWFFDKTRPDNNGPFLIVVDDFYPDPVAVRELALRLPFYQYSPPLPEQVGEATAGRFSDKRPAWLSTALLRYWGELVRDPRPGFRYAPVEVRNRIAGLLGEEVDASTWEEMGDWWNGAFHIQFDTWHRNRAAIHHHYKDGDVAPRGWSGVVYLSPQAPVDAGTSIWREKATGLCVAGKGAKFNTREDDFEMVFEVENRFNRLVLFRENVLHRLEYGFGGSIEDARLVQTFFFHAVPGS